MKARHIRWARRVVAKWQDADAIPQCEYPAYLLAIEVLASITAGRPNHGSGK